MVDDLPRRKPRGLPADAYLPELSAEVDRWMEEAWPWHLHIEMKLTGKPLTEEDLQAVLSVLRGEPLRQVED